MKITAVRAFYRENRQAVRPWQRHFWQFGVELQTDAGLAGIGVGGGGVAAVPIVRHALAPVVLGRDPLDVHTLWEEMYQATVPYGRRGIAIMAISGVDLALWDLVGKIHGRPVWRCLTEDSARPVRAYATSGTVEACHALGFRAFKLPIADGAAAGEAGMRRTKEKVARARAFIGPDAPLIIDCWMGWTFDYALEMAKRLAPFGLTWIEEPLPPDAIDGYAELVSAIAPTLVAAGEHEHGWHGYQEWLTGRLAGVVQPDVTWCGGITPACRIWRAARERGLVVAPHRGGEVWGLHLNCAFGGEWAEVVCLDGTLFEDPLVVGSPQPHDGQFSPPEAPGFGVRWREGIHAEVT